MAVFGETLRQARAYKGVTLKEAEQATRINRHHLAALEDENFAALPPLIYQRGIVRNYAAFLDLDPNKVLTMFEDSHGSAGSTTTVPMAVKPLDMPNHFTPNFAIIAFLVVLSAIVFAWVYSVYRGPSEVLPTPTMQTTVTPIATVDGAAPISATATPTPQRDAAAAETSPQVDSTATDAAVAQAARPMSEANERRTQVAATQAAGGISATARPTGTATNVEGNSSADSDDDRPTPDAAATEDAEVAAAEDAAAEEAAAAEQAAAREEAAAAEAEAAEATQLALDESLLTLSFSPAVGIYLTVIGDGTVIFDGNVAAGEIRGPYNATTFDIYTSDPVSTNITNLDTGQTFYMGSNSFSLP